MPKGWEAVQKAEADIERRKNSGGGGSGGFFNLKGGESAVVRFIADDNTPVGCWCHLKREGGFKWIPCLDQDEDGAPTGDPCPGCEAGGEIGSRKYRGWIAVLWRDAPVWARDENNKIVKGQDGKFIVAGNEDRIAVWNQGIEVFKTLRSMDGHYKGLGSRDFTVTRKGEGMDTTYDIFPADPDGGAQPLSDDDKALLENLPDLNRFTAKPSYEEWGSSSPSSASPANTGQQTGTTGTANPFLKTRS